MTNPSPRQLILRLLLSADDATISSRDAVAACSVFGVRENSVRVALVRLSSAGMVEAASRGTYRLGPNAAPLADDLRTWRVVESRVREWSGHWLAVHTAGLPRSDRSATRRADRALRLLGFRELDRDFFVRPDNLVGGVPAVRARLSKVGLDPETSGVFLASELDPERDSRARQLWNGEKLTKSYATMRATLDDWLERASSIELDVAARESFLLGHEAVRLLVFDPLLPAPLVDVEERREFVEAVLRFDRVGRAVWRRLSSGPSDEEATADASSRH